MAQETVSSENRTTVRCPQCGYFTLKGVQATKVEVNCANNRCRTTLQVSIADGVQTVKVIEKQ